MALLASCVPWLSEDRLAYGDCACSMSGSHNVAALPKRHDNSLFLLLLTKIKTVRKLLWPLLVVNLRIPGLI